MNQLSQNENPYGSPFFNNFAESILGALREDDVDKLLERAVYEGVTYFNEKDLIHLVTLSGRHPYRLQVAAASLFDAIAEGLEGEERYQEATEIFYERSLQHFEDVWNNLDDNARTILLLLCLVELGGTASGKSFAFGEIEQVRQFSPELRKLTKLGLVEKVSDRWVFDKENLLLWQGERWRVTSLGFVIWASEVVISRVRNVKKYDEWLEAKQYRYFLTEEQWQTLKKWGEKIQVNPGSLIKRFVGELLSLKK